MCTVLVATLVLGASAAVAECLDGRVTYQAPEGCPDAQYFCDRLIDRAGARLALEPTSRVHCQTGSCPTGSACVGVSLAQYCLADCVVDADCRQPDYRCLASGGGMSSCYPR